MIFHKNTAKYCCILSIYHIIDLLINLFRIYRVFYLEKTRITIDLLVDPFSCRIFINHDI